MTSLEEIVFGTVKAMFSHDSGFIALVTGFPLFIWMDMATLLSFGFLGFQMFTFSDFLNMIFNTPRGILFPLVGNSAGALIAFCVFLYSVISIPMLFDRDIDFVTAMETSVRFVIHNRRVMAVWFVVIAVSVTLSLLSGLIGLLLTSPVLGHETWHLYRRAVKPAETV